MGRIKEYYFEEIHEQAMTWKLANILGITYDDIMELEWEIETDSSKDDLVYNYRVVFSDGSPKEILSKIPRLEDGHTVYLHPWELDEEYDYDEQFDAITDNKEYVHKYKNEKENLEALSAIEIPEPHLKNILNRQIFIGVIGVMEAFLSEAFINLTFDNENYFKNFVKTHPEFKQRKFELREIFEESDKLNETAKKVMLGIIYHNLPNVRNMYRDTFEIKFPQIETVYEYVLKRHDLVHRNGHTKSGDVVETDEKTIIELIDSVNDLVDEIINELGI